MLLSMPKPARPCDECREERKKTKGARCPSCGRKARLCRDCYPVWIACSKECREKWRRQAALGLPSEKLIPVAVGPAKKPDALQRAQMKLF